ncbi:hypothetical protein ENUP19_0038G0056 [Entamoeba nuttalli]|uniref:Uncharacterized protein n=1 Tax=Entamoeba nuttalli TaxID=412467 RepID=A0ABQ0D9Q0_9EUKA
MNQPVFSKPMIITDENSLFSLLEEQQEDFEIVKQRICETPKYFKEAVETINQMNCVIDDYLQSIDSFHFTYNEDSVEDNDYSKMSPFYACSSVNRSDTTMDLEPIIEGQ